jgi:hypothetical protein
VPDEKNADPATRQLLAATQNAAPYGYLLLQLLGWYGLRGASDRRVRRAARWLGALLGLNLVLFLGLETGLIAQTIATIAVDIIVLFVSGVLGLISVIVAIILTLTGGIGSTRTPGAGRPTGPTQDRTGAVVTAGR